MTLLSAPAGSGKTILLRSWVGEMSVADSVAWVAVDPEERDPQRFWLSVLDALRATCAASTLVRALSAAPGLDGWAIVERLLDDLDSLGDRLWLVIDDLHELRSEEALRQLELLLMRAPAHLRFVLATRHDLRLGLHRLRLEGRLCEIRAGDLRFTLEQTQELFKANDINLSDSAVTLLHERTEGWAAGLRLAALSLAAHPDPERFATEYSGTERTVAEYLLAEVLERQPKEVRQLLLRTSMLEGVSGALADRLLGGQGAERTLQELEATNGFVVSLDAGRSWFRYHHLFADLLALELRRSEPGELPGLHRSAAEWFAEHGHPVEAVRHAQAAESWGLAARLLADNWFSLYLSGRSATAHRLLQGFPAPVLADDPELAALMAGHEQIQDSLEEAEGHLVRATKGLPSVPAERREQFQVTLGILRLCLARRRGDMPTVAEEAQRLLAPVEAANVRVLEMGGERRALALISLGIAETWSYRNEAAEHHLEQGVALARHSERPYLELLGLAHSAWIPGARSFALGAQRSKEAIELAERHGWSEEPIAGVAYAQLAGALVCQGQLAEAQHWVDRAERTLATSLEPAAGVSLHWSRGGLELVRGRPEKALEAFQAGERLAQELLTPHVDTAPMRARVLHTLVGLGHTREVEAAVAELDAQGRETAFTRIVTAALRLAGGDPQGATDTLAPAIAGSDLARHPMWLVEALLMEALAQHALADAGAAQCAIERALDLAEPEGMLFPFLTQPVESLLRARCRHRTSHRALVLEILDVLAGKVARSTNKEPERLREPLSESETRVLRYLPTNLSLRDIGNELYVSVHTVKTHAKHIYGKLDVHGRAEAVDRARALGLLAPSSRLRHATA